MANKLPYNCYSNPTIQALRDSLGLFDGNDEEKLDAAFTAIMILCDKIAFIEQEFKKFKIGLKLDKK